MKIDYLWVQTRLKQLGYDPGPIDGVRGPKTDAAVTKILADNADKLEDGNRRWAEARRAVAALQLILRLTGYPEVGKIDGQAGPDTAYAFDLWLSDNRHGRTWRDGEEDETPDPTYNPWPRQTSSDLVRFYGPAGGPQCTAGKVDMPFRMKIAWNKRQTITRFSCHELVADSAMRAYRKIADAYSPEDISRHGFDLFGGCYNFRKKRGGSTLSTHAFGIAIDTDPERNQLKWTSARAYLARPECAEFWRIWESEGWLSLGRARNYDWMHVQAARL